MIQSFYSVGIGSGFVFEYGCKVDFVEFKIGRDGFGDFSKEIDGRKVDKVEEVDWVVVGIVTNPIKEGENEILINFSN